MLGCLSRERWEKHALEPGSVDFGVRLNRRIEERPPAAGLRVRILIKDGMHSEFPIRNCYFKHMDFSVNTSKMA